MLRVVRPSNVNVKLPPDASHSTSCVSSRDVPPDGGLLAILDDECRMGARGSDRNYAARLERCLGGGKGAAAIGIPSLVGEIMCGVLLGPETPLTGLNFVRHDDALKTMGEIGLCLHALEAGLHVDLEMLEILGNSLEDEGITNVEPILGTITDSGLEPNSVDLILLVDVYHEFDHPWEMARSMRRALRPGGRVALVEYRANDPVVPIKPLHTMTAEQSRLEFEAAGYRLVETREDGLPWQRLQLFERVPASGTP